MPPPPPPPLIKSLVVLLELWRARNDHDGRVWRRRTQGQSADKDYLRASFSPSIQGLAQIGNKFCTATLLHQISSCREVIFQRTDCCVCGGKSLYGMQRCSSEVLIITILAKLLQLSCWKFLQRLEIAFRNCLKLSISFDNIQLPFEEDTDVQSWLQHYPFLTKCYLI